MSPSNEELTILNVGIHSTALRLIEGKVRFLTTKLQTHLYTRSRWKFVFPQAVNSPLLFTAELLGQKTDGKLAPQQTVVHYPRLFILPFALVHVSLQPSLSPFFLLTKKTDCLQSKHGSEETEQSSGRANQGTGSIVGAGRRSGARLGGIGRASSSAASALIITTVSTLAATVTAAASSASGLGGADGRYVVVVGNTLISALSVGLGLSLAAVTLGTLGNTGSGVIHLLGVRGGDLEGY